VNFCICILCHYFIQSNNVFQKKHGKWKKTASVVQAVEEVWPTILLFLKVHSNTTCRHVDCCLLEKIRLNFHFIVSLIVNTFLRAGRHIKFFRKFNVSCEDWRIYLNLFCSRVLINSVITRGKRSKCHWISKDTSGLNAASLVTRYVRRLFADCLPFYM
jgi:hypothetical protein